MRIEAFGNNKGGTGKTSTTLGIASAANARNLSLLIVDLDPQSNASRALGVPADYSAGEENFTITDVLDKSSKDNRGLAAQAIIPAPSEYWNDNIYVLPADEHLATFDSGADYSKLSRLKYALDSDELREKFDLVLIDCAPSLGILLANALRAADGIVLVSDASAPSIEGVSRTIALSSDLREEVQIGDVDGIIVNRYDNKLTEQRLRHRELTNLYPDLVWDPPLPSRVAVAEALGAQAPVGLYGKKASKVTVVLDLYLDKLLSL